MADGPRISNSLDPRTLVPDERAVVGGALRAQGRQNKNRQQQPTTPATTPRPWFRTWPAIVAAGATVAVLVGAVAIAAAGTSHKTPTATGPTTPGATTTTRGAAVTTPSPPVPSEAVAIPAPATTAAPVIPTSSVASAADPAAVRWHIVAVVRSLGPVPAKQDPYDVIDDLYAAVRPGQRYTEDVSCTPYYCLPAAHTFAVGETFAYWGLVGAGDGLRAAPLAFSESCHGNTWSVQPGFASTLSRISATSYTSTLSRPARTYRLQCHSTTDTYRTSSFVVDRTITKLP